jgi:class 3 adenylate cyclase
MSCPRCGTDLTSERNFCGDCGCPLPLTCRSCGSQTPPGKKFCGDCGAPLTTGLAEQNETGFVTKYLPAAAERRQLTVMFVDLVGSTRLSAQLDPEDLRNVITAYQQCITSVVARLDGFVARYMGDGALIYFGFPQAHEDDAERAVHAGLAINEAVRNLSTDAGASGTLACRVGIATGLVVVGDVIGFGSSLEFPVVGDTPNLAAGLIGIAEPGMVVIDETTRRLTGELFNYKTLGPTRVKGSTRAIHAWAALAESSISSRFEALRAGKLPLIGRTEELNLLMRRWGQARAGEGRVVLLSGEPGIGKSRLVVALEERIGPTLSARIQFLCSPHHRDSALYPVIRQIERAAQFERGDTPAVKLEKITRLIGADIAPDPDVAVIADLLSIPLAQQNLSDMHTPLRRKDVAFAALLRYLERLTRKTPLLVIFEDIHWADPTTLDLIDLVVETVERLPILMVVTSRPETRPPWATRPQVSVQMLSGLHRREAASLIDSVAEGRIAEQEMVDGIIARADGIPLFIEELTKTILDSRTNLENDQQHLPESLSPSAIPTTLQASLMSRLDRSIPAKEIAQIGSVIGREFSFDLVQGLSKLPRENLEEALNKLVKTGLATQHGETPHSNYTFKHALMQDAAYTSLLRERRRTIHLQLAELLEAETNRPESPLPEVIAWHFGEAGAAGKSIDYYLKAAARTTGRFALTERVSYLRKALGQVEHLANSTESIRRELDVQIALYQALIDEHGSGSEEVRLAVERARALCLKLGDTQELIRVQDGLFNYHFSHSQPETLLRYASEMRDVGQRTGNPQALIMARKNAGFANLLLGRLEAACEEMRLLVEAYDEVRDGYGALAVRDPKVGAYTILGICLTALGYPDSGAAKSLEAVRYADSLHHEVSQIVALRRACVQCIMKRDTQAVLELSERLLKLATRFETFKGVRDGAIFNSWAQLQTRRDPVLLERMRHSIEQFDATQYWALLPFFMTSAAELMARHNDSEGAVALVNRAAELAQLTGEQWSESEIIRLQACFCAPDPDHKISMLSASLDKARQQNAKLWELRSATSLAEVWLEQGNRKMACEILSPIVAWFTEGLNSPDFIAARAVLARTGGPESAVLGLTENSDLHFKGDLARP